MNFGCSLQLVWKLWMQNSLIAGGKILYFQCTLFLILFFWLLLYNYRYYLIDTLFYIYWIHFKFQMSLSLCLWLYRMCTPWRMAHMLATKLAPLPGSAACQVWRHASRHAYGWMSLRYSDSHPRQKQQEDMFEDDHDIDAVEAKLNSSIRWVLVQKHKSKYCCLHPLTLFPVQWREEKA